MKKKQRIPGYFKSNNKFRDKNNNLNSFLKSFKESFEFTKENWFVISSLSIICLCITLVRAYSVTFSGNIGVAAEYVQYYMAGNIYSHIYIFPDWIHCCYNNNTCMYFYSIN